VNRGWTWLPAAAIAGALVPATVILAIPAAGAPDGTGLIPYVAGPVTGLLLLLMMLAAPVQRSSARTVPDFAFSRLDSSGARYAAGFAAIAVSVLLALPLLQVSGSLLARITGMPHAAGVAVTGVALALVLALTSAKTGIVAQAAALLLRALALAGGVAIAAAAGLADPGATLSSAGSALGAGVPRISAAGLAGAASLFLALACGTAALPQVLGLTAASAGGREARAIALRSAALTAVVLAGGAVVAAQPAVLASMGPAVLMLALGALAASLAASFAAIAFAMPPARVRGRRPGRGRVAAASAAIAMTTAVLLADRVDLTPVLGWAFSLAAATLFPVMVLGSWYRGLTATGVVAGVSSAVGSTAAAALYATLVAADILPAPPEFASALAHQPALLTVPLAFAVTSIVSRVTRQDVAVDVDARMLRMHAPEELGVAPTASRDAAAHR
jgi:Na+(H+)/acetate symporter ActP